jgi:hypothetical protein
LATLIAGSSGSKGTGSSLTAVDDRQVSLTATLGELSFNRSVGHRQLICEHVR